MRKLIAIIAVSTALFTTAASATGLDQYPEWAQQAFSAAADHGGGHGGHR